MRSDLSFFRQALTPIALAIVSLVAAVALWVAVTNEENPTTDREFPVTIPVDAVGVPEGLAVLSMTPDAITVTVRATDATFAKLTASNFVATVNMTGIRETQSTQNIVVDVVGAPGEVGIVETTAKFARVVLETKASKTVPVQVNKLGSLAQGFQISATETRPEEVTVTGPASSVALVVRADADVNLTGVRSNIAVQYNLTPRDGGGAIQPRVSVDPTTAEVRLTVERQETPQVVPVLPDIQGQVAAGYNIVDIATDPNTILVTGPLEILQTLNSVETEPIDVGSATDTLTRSVEVKLPDGVQTDKSTVTVTILVQPAPGARAITVAPAVVNQPAGLTALIQTTSITVRVSGTAPVLNELTAGDIDAEVDLSGLTEGVHLVDIKVTVPSNVVLDSVEPGQAVIALEP